MSDYEIKKLQKRVTNGGMDRREFIKAATALGFAVAAPSLYSQAAYATPKKRGQTAPFPNTRPAITAKYHRTEQKTVRTPGSG